MLQSPNKEFTAIGVGKSIFVYDVYLNLKGKIKHEGIATTASWSSNSYYLAAWSPFDGYNT